VSIRLSEDPSIPPSSVTDGSENKKYSVWGDFKKWCRRCRNCGGKERRKKDRKGKGKRGYASSL
jgi:hypothetical protein